MAATTSEMKQYDAEPSVDIEDIMPNIPRKRKHHASLSEKQAVAKVQSSKKMKSHHQDKADYEVEYEKSPSFMLDGKDLRIKWWFKHTKFGCMKNVYVTHVEIVIKCGHMCIYCYVAGYKGLLKVPLFSLMDASDEDIIAVTMAKFDELANKRSKKWQDGMGPEMHLSISTDLLQPMPRVQEIGYIMLKTWLECKGLISVVSKGVPYSAEFQDKLLALFSKHADQVSYQGTCASLDDKAQSVLEPGAPAPVDRINWLKKVAEAGVKRVSGRINPLVPSINDSRASIHAIIEVMHSVGIKRVAVSYAYGSRVIFANMKKHGIDVEQYYAQVVKDSKDDANLAPKRLVPAEKRIAMTEDAIEFGKILGVVVSTCGCDNMDIYPNSKCGISWRSGGPKMDPVV